MFVFAGAGGQFQLWPVPAASQWSGGQVPRRGEKTGRVSLPGQPGSPRGGYWPPGHLILTFCMTGRDVSREPGADRLYFIPEYKLELISHKLREKMICILFSSSSSKDESTKC